MRVYLAATPENTQEAARHCRALAHIAYRIGPASTLLRQNLLLQAKGGLLSVSDREAPLIENPEALCAAITRECSRREYTGVLLDFEEAPRPDRLAFAKQLEKTLSRSRKALYLPESYASVAGQSIILICTAISGGNFAQRLREAIAQRGGDPSRLALDIQRLRMDFRLPAPSGSGKPLTQEAFQTLTEQEKPAVFFSPDLCARYFTYTQGRETHFVLFDDADTLRQKIKMGNALGFSAAFFMWPEVQDIAGRLFQS